MYILSIDVGIINLGLVGAHVNENFTLNKIDICKLIDIRNLLCNDPKCELYHDSCIADYMSHLFKIYKKQFESADVILIERQPPTGLVAVQELIVYSFRNKTKMISPNSMHCYFNIGNLDYDNRKKFTVKFASDYLNGHKDFVFNQRKHDLADSVCILVYYLYNKSKEYQEKKRREEWVKDNYKFTKDIMSFRYIQDD